MPFTRQVTAVFDVLETVAVNCRVAPRKTLALAGLTLTVTAGGEGAGEVTPPPQPHASSAKLSEDDGSLRMRGRMRSVIPGGRQCLPGVGPL